MDILLQTTSAKIARMPPRRQKIALARKPKTLFKKCHPIAVGDLIPTDNPEVVTLDVTFTYEYAAYNIQGAVNERRHKF